MSLSGVTSLPALAGVQGSQLNLFTVSAWGLYYLGWEGILSHDPFRLGTLPRDEEAGTAGWPGGSHHQHHAAALPSTLWARSPPIQSLNHNNSSHFQKAQSWTWFPDEDPSVTLSLQGYNPSAAPPIPWRRKPEFLCMPSWGLGRLALPVLHLILVLPPPAWGWRWRRYLTLSSPLRPAKSWACTLASLYPFHLPTIFKLRYQVCQGVPLTLPSLKAGAEHVSQNPLRAKNHLLYCFHGASRCLSCGKCPTSICWMNLSIVYNLFPGRAGGQKKKNGWRLFVSFPLRTFFPLKRVSFKNLRVCMFDILRGLPSYKRSLLVGL